MTDAPEDIAVCALYEEMQRIRARVPTSRWFFFGSITATKRPVGDIDLLVVCKTTIDCVTVRTELACICSRFPIHLLLMTKSEEAEVKFIQAQSALEITSSEAISVMKTATTDVKKGKSGLKKGKEGASPSELIDARIKELGDWRGEMLSRLRTLIKEADPEVVEEWKWRGVPVWYHDGMICTGETYKNVVKMTFAKGAALKDPAGLFNSSLDGNTRRAIDFHEGDNMDEEALKSLVRAAVTLNKPTA
jgi:hypothetical protein